MQQTPKPSRRVWKRRALSLLLALVMVLGLVPVFPVTEASAHWADTYLSQLVEWGFIRADQANNPDRALTRADFMAIVNRAYGYHEEGETPFEDIKETDWFYDDVGIAYTARYIKGTSPTTASPNNPLTRETAATILGRNMMLQESPGELVDFSDAHQISTWASGTIKSSLEHYLIGGYDDGTFRPKRNVSWGEMASMLTNLVGTPLQEPGEYSLGGVYGNVTITSPDVKLRDTVISGDLYISGGVGLGGIELENVTVLGRIVACGTGQAEGGQASILLRNVTADELLVDNLQDHYVSLRADGITEIGKTTVRTSAYIEDNTPDGMGLHYISLEGESYPEGEEPEDWVPIQLDLAGRIEEVVNRTPRSQVRVGAGTVAKLTVDETAEGSNVIIDRGAVVKELNLDTATLVTGQGDIEHLTVNAPGCEVEMLPDKIDIRPGLTAIIAGEEMDTVGAKESSEQPMILAGYPEAQDIVPTGLDAAFMTNKAGTVYWAVTAITDGSVGEEDLIKPPSYGNIAVRNGSVKVLKGNEETISKVTGLTPGGSYYLSAILVDARGQRSTVKVIAFTTPDNTVPAFCAGYPKMSSVGTGLNPNPDDEKNPGVSQVVVMPNKDCKLYYALLPQGATAPTENELKSSAVSGALGYGVLDVYKNKDMVFQVHDQILKEETTYVLYLWLTDADGVNKGKITSLTFTTDDETPPEFNVELYGKVSKATSVTMEFQLNEDGVVYWVAFPTGSIANYPKGRPTTGETTAPLNSDYAIQQIVNGSNLNADSKSSGSKGVAAKANTNVTFEISGLKKETSYDVYYVAKDDTGPDRNYSLTVKKTTISTLDDNPPVFTQSFSLANSLGEPFSNTSIYLDVTEDVRYADNNGGRAFTELYRDATNSALSQAERAAARKLLSDNLRATIQLYQINQEANKLYDTPVTINYDQVTVVRRATETNSNAIRITFPSGSVSLENSERYVFVIRDLTDTTAAENRVQPEEGVCCWAGDPRAEASGTGKNGAGHDVPDFLVAFASVEFSDAVLGTSLPIDRTIAGNNLISNDGKTVSSVNSARFCLTPQTTSTVDPRYCFDILLWNDKALEYDLYYRIVDEKDNPLHQAVKEKGTVTRYEYTGKITSDSDDPDAVTSTYNLLPQQAGAKGSDDVDRNGWIYLGPSGTVIPQAGLGRRGRSVNMYFNGCDESNLPSLAALSDNVKYQFVMTVRPTSSATLGTVDFYINVAAGQPGKLIQLGSSPNQKSPEGQNNGWEELKTNDIRTGIRSVGNDPNATRDRDTFHASCTIKSSGLPSFKPGEPEFTPGETGDSVSIKIGLNPNGVVYYAISEVDPTTGYPNLAAYRGLMEDEDPSEIADRDKDDNLRISMNLRYDTSPPPEVGTSTKNPMPAWMVGAGGTPTADNPSGSNLIVTPTNKDFVTKIETDGFDSSETVAYGSVPSKDSPLEIENLKPNTNYFAYFVITNTGDPETQSHLYIYRFKTGQATRPRTDIQSKGSKENPLTPGNVQMGVDSDKYTVNWTVYPLTRALSQISILSKPFYLFTDHPGTDSDGNPLDLTEYFDTDGKFDAKAYKADLSSNGTPEIYLYKSDGTPFSVYDALKEPYSYWTARSGYSSSNLENYYFPQSGGSYTKFESGYTVFDMYANKDARQFIYNLIFLGAPGSPETAGDAVPSTGAVQESMSRTTKRGDFYYKLKEISQESFMQGDTGVRYLFLMDAINPQMEAELQNDESPATIASFRAGTFQKDSFDPPEITGYDGYITKDPNGNTYSGEASVYFKLDTYLMAKVSGEDSLIMTDQNLLHGRTDIAQPASGGNMLPKKGAVLEREFTINIQNVPAGGSSYIQFPANYFGNVSSISLMSRLRISVKEDTEDGVKEVCLVIELDGVKVYRSPVESSSSKYEVFFLEGGKRIDELKLSADNNDGNKSADISIDVYPPELENLRYKWSSDTDAVVKPDHSDYGNVGDGGTETITADRPGKGILTLEAWGSDANGSQYPRGTLPVVVTGTVDEFTGSNIAVNKAADAKVTAANAIEMMLGDGHNPSATLTVTANGKPLSDSAEVAIIETTGPVTARKVGANKVTLTPSPSAEANDTAEVTIGLVSSDSAKTPLTLSGGRQTVTITFETDEPTGASLMSVSPVKTSVKPTLTLSGSKLKANGSNYKLELTAKSLTEVVTATTTGVSGTVAWNVTAGKDTVVKLTGSGSKVTITALAAGTATIEATIGSLKKTIAVTVVPTITLSEPTVNTDIKKNTDGTYTWSRKSTGARTVKLTFTSDIPLLSAPTVVSTAPNSLALYNTVTLNSGGKSGSFQLDFKAATASSAKITFTAGGVTKTLTFNLAITGNDSGITIAGASTR